MSADDQLSKLVNQILNGENEGDSPSFASREVSEGVNFSIQMKRKSYGQNDPSFSPETVLRQLTTKDAERILKKNK
ncbi:hypothetical protein FB550_101770 [Neobacillus bataviensis]|uniref:Uncharacterized protein n=1 Tax=Neobacillus bataviensis TaxID=220685 RepID=A0A561DZI4_9BACI|nr:hypothetical protein [Neobacillus bataviensis]TWE08742.1 hypothetical protein FB550_101770 [Neobacillus bataviensis]